MDQGCQCYLAAPFKAVAVAVAGANSETICLDPQSEKQKEIYIYLFEHSLNIIYHWCIFSDLIGGTR